MLRDARERYDVPVVEVILPATRRAVAATRTGRIGVIGTRATVDSLAYDDAFAAAPHVELVTRACPGSSTFVERGVTGGAELTAHAHDYLDPLVDAGVDTLILGCTHYPLLTGVISMVMGDGVTLVSSAEECAKDVYKLLARTGTSCARTAPDVPVPHHRLARRVPGDRAPLPRARSWRWRPTPLRQPGRRLMRLTVVGCSGFLPRPRLAGQLLPGRGSRRRGSHLAAGPRHGQRRPRRPAQLHRPARPSTPSRCPTCTPTTASTSPASTCCGATTPAGLARGDPGVGSGGHRRAASTRAYDLPPSPGMTGDFDFRTYDEPFRVGPFEVEPTRSRTRSADLRLADHRRRPDAHLLRRLRGLRRPRRVGARRRPVPRRGARSSRARTTLPTCT